nr:DUF6510 family protein [Nonomuraea polychroma]
MTCSTARRGPRTASTAKNWRLSTAVRPRLVARCPGCAEVVLRLVRGLGTAWLDLRGAVSLRVSLPD